MNPLPEMSYAQLGQYAPQPRTLPDHFWEERHDSQTDTQPEQRTVVCTCGEVVWWEDYLHHEALTPAEAWDAHLDSIDTTTED